VLSVHISHVCIHSHWIFLRRRYGESHRDGLRVKAAGSCHVSLNDLRCKHCREANFFGKDERLSGPQTISVTRPDPLKVNLKSSAFQIEWNKTGSLLLVRWGNALPLFSSVSRPSQSRPLCARRKCSERRTSLFVPFTLISVHPDLAFHSRAFQTYLARTVESGAKRKFSPLLRDSERIYLERRVGGRGGRGQRAG
jgi:hypothetical protein